MSLLVPKNYMWSVAGLVVGGIVGLVVGSQIEGGELRWPIALAGCVGGLLLGGLLRVVFGR